MILRILITFISILLPYPLIKAIKTGQSKGLLLIVLYFLIFFLLHKLLTRLLLRFSGKFNQIPILGFVNRLLGSFAGLCFAFLITYYAVYLLNIVSIFSFDVKLFIEQSKLIPLFNNIF